MLSSGQLERTGAVRSRMATGRAVGRPPGAWASDNGGDKAMKAQYVVTECLPKILLAYVLYLEA